jgi:exonuclease III
LDYYRDSFWSFNDGSGGQRLGLNGVTTFVRNGLCLSANGAPLGDLALDGEGRCVLTDHGTFVVFNVYVPNAGNGSRLPYKQQWLHGELHALILAFFFFFFFFRSV